MNLSPFVLKIYASPLGLSSVLEQKGGVIAYAYRAFNKAEEQYSAIQKECVAAVFSMKQFKHYLLRIKFHRS